MISEESVMQWLATLLRRTEFVVCGWSYKMGRDPGTFKGPTRSGQHSLGGRFSAWPQS
jgi:hypothetical protein